jgi:hypothetical protein
MFLGFSILLSISLNGQALRENAISIEGNAGYEQQKINIGYSYNAGRFESSENKNQSNQFILGFEAGLFNIGTSIQAKLLHGHIGGRKVSMLIFL